MGIFRLLIGTSAVGAGYILGRAARVEKAPEGAPARTILFDLQPPTYMQPVKAKMEDSFGITLPKTAFKEEPNIQNLTKALYRGNVFYPQKTLFAFLNKSHDSESKNFAVGETLIGEHFTITHSTNKEFVVVNEVPDKSLRLNLWIRIYPVEDQVVCQIGTKGWAATDKAGKMLNNPVVTFLHDQYSRILLDNAVRSMCR